MTLNFLREVRPPRVGINWYVPLPGSNDYNKLKQSGLIQIEDPCEWRRIGESLTSGRVYASVPEDRFRQLFSTACKLASELHSPNFDGWSGPVNTFKHNFIRSDSGGKKMELKEPNVESIKNTEFSSFSVQLREKWREIPATRQGRVFSSDLLNWSDEELLAFWEKCRRQTCVKEVRGWYQNTYKDMFKGCEIADVDPRMGIDSIFFAQHGAKVTFIDIVQDNLKLLERICNLKRIKAKFYYIDDFFSYHFENTFDVFMFIGSLINAPFEFTRRQVNAMMPFLRVGGKVVILAYPKERYEKLGAKDFIEFGKMTDGERTPWCEWYDDNKIKALFGNNFTLNWSRNFGQDGIEFNWFDLTKVKEDNSVSINKESTVFKPSGMWENFRGEYLFTKGDIEESFKAFTNAIEIEPNLAVAHNNLGVVYWQAGEFGKAGSYFKKAFELDPNDRYIILNCIKVLISSGKIEDAKKVYSNYIKNNPWAEEICQVLLDFTPPDYITVESEQKGPIDIPIIFVKDLHKKLGFDTSIKYPKTSLVKPLSEWKMEIDDSPIFRYIYRNIRPKRHLEFGTWQGQGVIYCLEESDATVWTINLPFGEDKTNGSFAYSNDLANITDLRVWARKIGLPEQNYYRTDSLGFIGRLYLEKEMGHRVCQIYCDSRKWDITNYPTDFFDTVLIDGAHAKDIVINDTIKALRLLKRGGLIMWHDFCPPLYGEVDVVRGVLDGVLSVWDDLVQQMEQIFWIYPSWILLGVKK